MKKTILLAYLIATTVATIKAQNNAGEKIAPATENIIYKAQKSDYTVEALLNLQTGSQGIGIGLNELKIRYFYKNNFAFRCRFKYSSTNYSNKLYDYNLSNPPADVKETDNEFNLALGAEYHFTGTPKLSPYLGAELGMGLSNQKLTATNFDGHQYSMGDNYEKSITGGQSFLIGLVFGADYYITKGVYLGGEISYGFGYQFNGYQNENMPNSAKTTKELSTTYGMVLQANSGLRIGVKF